MGAIAKVLPRGSATAAAAVLLTALIAGRAAASTQENAPTVFATPPERYTGDLDSMVERRTIRVLTVYSQTIFFFDNGTPHGIAFDALTAFGEELNRRLRTGDRRIGMRSVSSNSATWKNWTGINCDNMRPVAL